MDELAALYCCSVCYTVSENLAPIGFILMPLALLSPAKTLNEDETPGVAMTEPPFAEERGELLEVCKALDKAQLKGLMSLSEPLAGLNYRRFQHFEEAPSAPAAWAFDGPAHKALDIRSLAPDAQSYAQESVVTLSGLYGCLRPRDAIRYKVVM